MSTPLDFQSMILTLQEFWAKQGCMIWQPYYSQVGAGTMNPATFLRVLGPEPWKVAYVEPSVRPDDGRYGENPNRLQQHYQFQVILKPDPGNPQELYLQSLEALGIDPRQHDIRFVEDNWEQPALGAWGLGWEVWLDGQEITQFTYFQQAGGLVLDPVSVEITYGLERIAMPLQRVHNFREIQWSPSRTYGDVNLAAEQQHSKYYFEIADVERLRQMYALFEAEAQSALDNGLVLPAHDYILKCSHTFNVLDTRGAVGVTERQAIFGRMREMAHRVSEAYVEQRKKLEFPWLKDEPTPSQSRGGVAAAQATKGQTVSTPVSSAAAPFLFEIGTEELPAADLNSALDQLQKKMPAVLAELNLSYESLKVMGTPRRLVVLVTQLSGRQPDRKMVVKGPPADRAFDAFGQPTKAGEGFARSKGLSAKDLQIQEIDGGRYAVAEIEEVGRPAIQVLAEALPGVIAGIHFDKTMRWNNSGVAFSRPIRWLLALFGTETITFEYAGYTSNRSTFGLRFLQPEEIVVNTPADYFAALKAQGIILEQGERKEVIRQQVAAIIAAQGGNNPVDEDLLDEVNNLVEAPTSLCGSFDPKHLQVLPPDVIISVMKKHQRYFPIKAGNTLLPFFVVVRNGDREFADVVTDGNEQVIRARFADASFFVAEDLKHPLADYLPRLATLTFQKKLGTMLDKSQRIGHLVEALQPQFSLDATEAKTALRAAELCKVDLATKMVIEMTSLQGVMGRYYALHSGETEAVAQAIFEHYLPRFAGEGAPQSRAGLLVGVADRLDTLAGLFAAGMAPTGTKDPFAQRRCALGLVLNLMSFDLDFDLAAGLKEAARYLPIAATDESQAACLDFIVGRMRSALIDQGFRYDVVDAVLTVQKNNPAGVNRAINALTTWVKRTDWNTILPAYARCVRITRDLAEKQAIERSVLVTPEEKALLSALDKAQATFRKADSVDQFMGVFVPMIPEINRFFEKIMVMDENPVLRSSRLGMLQQIAALAAGVVDLSLLEGF